MKAELTADAKTAFAPQSRNPPADEQSIKRFKALVERERGSDDPEPAEPKAAPFELSPRRREDLSDQGQGGSAFGEKAKPLAAAVPEAPPAPAQSDGGDRVAELQKASELALGLDRAHARPTATQLLLPGDTAIAGGTIAQGAVPGAIDIAIHPGSQLLLADSLETLRRRLAARGLTIGQLRVAGAEEQEAE